MLVVAVRAAVAVTLLLPSMVMPQAAFVPKHSVTPVLCVTMPKAAVGIPLSVEPV
jgi:hypothetical protein